MEVEQAGGVGRGRRGQDRTVGLLGLFQAANRPLHVAGHLCVEAGAQLGVELAAALEHRRKLRVRAQLVRLLLRPRGGLARGLGFGLVRFVVHGADSVTEERGGSWHGATRPRELRLVIASASVKTRAEANSSCRTLFCSGWRCCWCAWGRCCTRPDCVARRTPPALQCGSWPTSVWRRWCS